MDERSEYGQKIFGELMGEKKAAAFREHVSSTGFASEIWRLARDFAFADIWGREGLERKHRSLVTLGILIATRQTLELKNHIRIAVRNGLTVRELEEVLLQCLPCLGFPPVATAATAMIETLQELGLDLRSKTAEETGLL